MKKIVTIKKYIPGLASFLDEQKTEWYKTAKEEVKIKVKSYEELFNLGFRFGVWHEEVFLNH